MTLRRWRQFWFRLLLLFRALLARGCCWVFGVSRRSFGVGELKWEGTYMRVRSAAVERFIVVLSR
jgi:hypothetical protein